MYICDKREVSLYILYKTKHCIKRGRKAAGHSLSEIKIAELPKGNCVVSSAFCIYKSKKTEGKTNEANT